MTPVEPNRPPTQQAKPGSWLSLALLLLLVFGGMKASAWWQQERLAAAVQAHARPNQILMYTTSTCVYCAKARAWLDAHSIPWRECNIDLSAACRVKFEAQGAPGVPLLQVNGQWHLGFDAAWLARVLQVSPATGADQPKPNTDKSPRP